MRMGRHVLAQANPLLTDIAAVEGGTLAVSVAPEDLQLPAERLVVRLAPTRCGSGCARSFGY